VLSFTLSIAMQCREHDGQPGHGTSAKSRKQHCSFVRLTMLIVAWWTVVDQSARRQNLEIETCRTKCCSDSGRCYALNSSSHQRRNVKLSQARKTAYLDGGG
jgi:hypothetical protein